MPEIGVDVDFINDVMPLTLSLLSTDTEKDNSDNVDMLCHATYEIISSLLFEILPIIWMISNYKNIETIAQLLRLAVVIPFMI